MSDNKPVIFISYSHRDRAALEYIRSHLGPIAGLGVLSIWDDNELQIGDDWKGDINSAIDACAVFILLVSRHSLSSKFIREVELPRILPRWQSKQARFCPIVVTPCHLGGYWWLDAANRRPKDGKALSELNEPLSDREMTAIVDEIAKFVTIPFTHIIGEASPFDVPEPVSAHRSKLDIVDYDHLPETPYKALVGRETELAALDEAWIDKLTNIVSLVAWGGTGKSALVNEWLLQMRGDNYRGADKVLGWSFYSQGTKERATSAEGFFDWALAKLMIAVAASESTNTKAERLAEAIAERRVLLVLDGIEPLQHGPDGQEGYLKDQGMRTFLRRFAATPPADANGLIVITSRLEVRDIEGLRGSKEHPGPHRYMFVHQLSDEAGAALLKDNGVQGTEPDRQAAAREFGGHALALSLLASFLGELHDNDVRRRDHVQALLNDSNSAGHGHAWRVMASINSEWLHLNPILRVVIRILGPKYFPTSYDKLIMQSVLYLVGLFDRPASSACLNALRGRPAIRGLTDAIVDVDDNTWKRAVARLRKIRLLGPDDQNSPETLDAHPLVREWFGGRLKKTNEVAWRQAHGRLYEYLRDSTKEGEKPTLESLGPLYQAIGHGCRAGRHKEVLEKIYLDRICQRGSDGKLKFYSSYELGAIGSDLAAVSWFFAQPYEVPIATLTEATKSMLLSDAAYSLRAQGRFSEAMLAERAGLQMDEKLKDWANAAISAASLSTSELLVGEGAASVESAKRSVEFADKSGDEFQIVSKRSALAYALHALGRRTEAKALFEEAELRQRQSQPEYPLLYSRAGYEYCDLLLSNRDYVAARDRAIQTLKWGEERYPLLSRSLDLLTLGRAYVGLAVTDHNILQLEDFVRHNARAAGAALDEAVDSFRAAGTVHHIPRGLLARAVFRRSIGDWEGGSRDLNEVQEIAEWGPMKLFLCDTALERGRLAFAKIEAFAPLNGCTDNSPPKPVAPNSAEATSLIKEAAKQLVIVADYIRTCGYHRRDEELAELEAVLRSEQNFADLPPRV